MATSAIYGSVTFGYVFETPTPAEIEKSLRQDRETILKASSCNFLGYIPAIGGIYAGVKRISSLHKTDTCSWKVTQVMRGMGEILCLGPLFFVIDTIATVARLLFSKMVRDEDKLASGAKIAKFNGCTSFGYLPVAPRLHSETSETNLDDLNEKVVDAVLANNLWNFIGYFPVLGGVTAAISRIALLEADDPKSWRATQIMRGVGEILCLGPLFALADMVGTVAHILFGQSKYVAKKPQSNPPPVNLPPVSAATSPPKIVEEPAVVTQSPAPAPIPKHIVEVPAVVTQSSAPVLIPNPSSKVIAIPPRRPTPSYLFVGRSFAPSNNMTDS